MNLLLIIFASLLLSIYTACQMLTDAENEERKRVCGKNMRFNAQHRRKVLNGVNANIEEAPWNVALEVMTGEPPGLCTGSIVSPRHVITARHCFAELKDGVYRWLVGGQPVPGCGKSESKNDVVVEQMFEGIVKLFTGADCGYRKYCGSQSFSEVRVQRLILPGICDDRTLDNDDLAIVELTENLNFTKKVRPICVAHDDSDIFDDGVKMKLFGYGLNPANGEESAGPLTFEDVHAKQCFATVRKSFCTESYSGKQLGCVGDSGGGVVRVVDKRITLAGVLYQGTECHANTRNEQDFNVNVAFYSDDICKHAGICQGTTSLHSKKIKEMKKDSGQNEWGVLPQRKSKMMSTSQKLGETSGSLFVVISTIITLI